jgi:predicted component of type VI protein secretion system
MPSGPFRSDGAQPVESSDDAAGYRLLVGTRAIMVEPGETLLGRAEDCGIVVSHSTVSRRHASIVLEDGCLSIEDLGSANGTYVNKARAHGRVPLKRGDWIALGSYELEVLQRVPSGCDDEGLDRPTPISGMGVLGQVALSKRSPESYAAPTDRKPRRPRTEAEDFESAGRLADRMFAAGRPHVAEEILAEPMMRVLEAAQSGALPATPVVDALGSYAMKLANATGELRWVDVAIEVHLLTVRPFRVETLRQLETIRSRGPLGNDALIARYYETIRARLWSMGPDERILVSLVADFVFGLDRNG